ncbi:MAG TPA: murein L,D-transpeptidase catalytic domain family protein, partial [Chitinophagaceae bacterium]|nr:murein L,D-transpeptidase catalytic domain family protein [Chitinophagaceae bacterium]
NKTGFLLVSAAFVLLIISCTAADKNKFHEPSPVVKTGNKKATKKTVTKKRSTEKAGKKNTVSNRASEIAGYANQNGYSTKYCFLIDMSLSSGRNRFFVYDLEKRSVAYSALVAHGSCNETFISQARFSNTNNSGCSSPGKYKVGAFYHGKYGESYRLHGLDKSNSNAFRRGVVIHGYDCVPDEEIYPRVLCNSLGCPMVSYNFFDRLSRIIKKSKQPILLWIYR